MRVAIVHQEIADAASLDELDTRLQADAVAKTLRSQKHETIRLGASLHLADLERSLRESNPDVIFNLVESLNGSDRLLFLAPALYDTLGIPYTGCPTESLVVTSNKLLAKQHMLRADLPTAAWCASDARNEEPNSTLTFPARYIFKSVFEHGSWGMDEQAVMEMRSEEELRRELQRRQRGAGRVCFAERYIEGREFNVAILERGNGPQVLPIGEILFDNFPGDKPKIVCYQAKWAEGTFEYENTPRRFHFASADRRLIEQLKELSLACWRLFGLRGYARVDFRVDEQGQPWILEINANPCLTPEAGYWSMLGEAKIPYGQAIAAILATACSPILDRSTDQVTTTRRSLDTAVPDEVSPIPKERHRGSALAPRTDRK